MVCVKVELLKQNRKAGATLSAMNKITQDMRFKQVVIEYSLKKGVTAAAIHYSSGIPPREAHDSRKQPTPIPRETVHSNRAAANRNRQSAKRYIITSKSRVLLTTAVPAHVVSYKVFFAHKHSQNIICNTVIPVNIGCTIYSNPVVLWKLITP